MSFFPSDWDDEENEEEFEANVEELAREFETRDRDDFSSRELLEIFKFYSFNQFGGDSGNNGIKLMKMVLLQGFSQFPYMPVFAIHLVEVLIREKNYRLARRYIAQAREYNNFEPALYFLEAVICGLEGKKEKAQLLAGKGLEYAGEDEEILEDSLELLIFYNQFETALTVLNRAIMLNADVVYILDKFFHSTTDKKIIMELLPMMHKMVDENPYSEDAWYLLGSAYLELENAEKSIWAYDFAVTINENFLEAWIGYLEAIYESEDYAIFIKHYTEQEQRFGAGAFDELEGLLAWSNFEMDEVGKARKIYRKVLEKNSTDGESWYSLGLTWHYEKNYQTAIPFLEKAYKLNPSEPDYGIVLAASYFGLGNQEKWSVLYPAISELYPEQDEIWLDWSVALYKTGDVNAALEVIQEGLKINPGNFKLMYRLAALCYLTGQKEVAYYLLENALAINIEEHVQIFIFAPELKKATSLLKIIAKFTSPSF